MYDDKIIHTLTDKINELLERYNELKETNESLRNELVSVKAQNEAQKNEIARLENRGCAWKVMKKYEKSSSMSMQRTL